MPIISPTMMCFILWAMLWRFIILPNIASDFLTCLTRFKLTSLPSHPTSTCCSFINSTININYLFFLFKRKYVALCETGEKPTISIYDLHSLRRKKSLGIPYDASGVTQFSCISFSFDNRYLAAVTGEPDQTMLVYQWEKGKVESSIKLINPQNTSVIFNLISCNPGDVGIVAIAGLYCFKLLTVSETVWRPYGFAKADNLLISSIVWLNSDRLFAGTQDGRILFLENGDLKNIFTVMETIFMNLKVREEFVINPSQMNLLEERDVRCLVSFPKGFAFGFGSRTVIVFERDGQHKYLKKHIFIVPIQVSRESKPELYKINAICVNPSSDRLIVTTGWSQLFYAKLFSVDSILEPEKLEILGQALHNGPISGISMCSWKSIFMTCGQTDRSVRIWDYESECLVMIKQYTEDVFCVSLHPIGLFCLIGFSDKLRFLTIIVDDLLPTQEFSIRSCRTVSFCHGGHLFAAVNGNVVQIYSTIGFLNRYLLKGHTGRIKQLVWGQRDLTLVTIGSEGAIYIWELSTGLRICEVILKGISLDGIGLSADCSTLYCIASDSKIREIKDSVITREFQIKNIELTSLLMGKSDSLMFITSPGGSILSFKFPLQEPIEYQEFHIHCANITTWAVSFNEQIVVSAAEDGTLCFWKIIYTETTVESRDLMYTHEILIGKNDLEENIKAIHELNVRMKELENEQAYKMRQMDVLNNDKMREVHQGYCEAIDELKMRIDKLQEDRTNELNNINVEIVKIKSGHDKTLQQLEMDYNAKLIAEYDKFVAFEESHHVMRQNYEQKLEDLKNNHSLELKKIVENYTGQIYQKNQLFEELQEEIADHVRVHEQVKAQIEDDADREIVEIRSNYESQLYEERQTTLKLKGEAGVLRNRYSACQKTIDDLKRQISHLRGEHKRYQKTIQDLERDTLDLKNEITERDTTIQEKEKRIYDLQRNNQELEKYKFVLNYKITELKNQIEPRDDDIKELNIKINDMETELVNLHKSNVILELRLNESRETVAGAKREIAREVKKTKHDQQMLKKIRTDLAKIISVIQEPQALKNAVKQLYHRYSADDEFLQSSRADSDVQCEFLRQRDQLERTIASLRRHVYRKAPINPRISPQINQKTLNEDIQALRELLKIADKHIIDIHGGGEIIAQEAEKLKVPLAECHKIVSLLRSVVDGLLNDLKES